MAVGEIPETLLDLIYDAAGENHLWSVVMQRIAQHLGSAGGILFGQSIRDKAMFFEHNGGLCDDCSRIYRERHMHNPWSLHMMRQPEGRVVSSDEVLPFSALQKTEFFNDVIRPQGLGHNAMMGLAARRNFIAAFNINRGSGQGPFEREELDFLDRLAPHMQRSLRLGFRLDAYRALQCAQYEVLDRLAMGVILLDQEGMLLYANGAAQTLCGNGSALSLRGGSLTHTTLPHARRLDSLIQNALAGSPMGALGVPMGDDGLSWTVLAVAVRGQDVGRFSDGSLKDAAVIVFISDPASGAGVPRGWLEGAYGFTAAEAAVAAIAATGANVPSIARNLRISPNTVKTHLRRVFAKTGVNGQAEFVRVIAPLNLVAGCRSH